MCRVPPDVQRQCSEAVAIIAAEDFPAKWNNLLPELVSRFGSEDMNIVVGCLTTASSILKRFRYVERNDALYADLKYVLDHLQKPLLVLFKQISATVRSAGASAAGQSDLPLRVEALRIMCRIFYSLNWQDLPEFFEDHMNEWMEEFAAYLQYENPALVDDDEETRPGPIDKLQEAIVGNLSLYASKDEEPFLPFLPKFTGFVWKLLMQVTPLPKHDGLMAVLIKFLSGLVGKQMHRALFQDYSSLQQIVTHIVVPNIKVREVDVECFEDDPADFILADMEGSESDSRRRCCCDLLRSMTRQFQKETTELCMQHVHTMLAEFSSDPINKWEQKDAVIHLVLAVSVLAQSADFGVSQVNEGVDVMDFFTKHILPELQSTEHDVRPLVKADSIKFVHTFRNQFSVEQLSALMPLLIAHLGSPSIVVHTYAAACIEKILTTRENINAKTFKFGKAQFQPFLEPMFTALFRIVDSPDPENEYVMKAVMRSLSVAREDIIPVTQMMIGKLTEALGRVCKNPSNPHYNHYLFESIAVLIRSVCVNDPRFTTAFEELLFPPFQTVLQMDVAEFTPYVFQILAQLLEFRTDGMSTFETLFPPLLQPVLWERTGNVPALARLIQAYLKKGASTLIKQGHLMPILGVFQKLISSKKNEVHAFSLLGTLITVVEKENIMPHFGTLFQILLMRLQQGKSSRFAHLITIFFGTFVAKFGATLFLEQTNAIQPGLGIMLLSNVWLPNLKEGSFTPIESKAQVLALTQLLCNTPVLFTDANGEKVWEAAIFMSLKVLNSNALQGRASAASDEDDLVEISYDAAFSRLRFAALVVDDPFVGIKNPGANLAQELNRLCASKPGQFLPVIQRAVQGDEKVTATLQLILGNAGVTLV
mmetsp:Transcript_32189/g.74101  ORF Transcript_32189/g.74101 Transcript_32189/m.74101 type:complete len:878 (+) Transcript_32189:372-3005(+)